MPKATKCGIMLNRIFRFDKVNSLYVLIPLAFTYLVQELMLCYVMLCYVMLCYVMLCYVMLCYVMLFILFYFILFYFILFYLILFYFIFFLFCLLKCCGRFQPNLMGRTTDPNLLYGDEINASNFPRLLTDILCLWSTKALHVLCTCILRLPSTRE